MLYRRPWTAYACGVGTGLLIVVIGFLCSRPFPQFSTEGLTLGELLLRQMQGFVVLDVSPPDGSSGLNIAGETLTVTLNAPVDRGTITSNGAAGECVGSVQVTDSLFETCLKSSVEVRGNVLVISPSLSPPRTAARLRLRISTAVANTCGQKLAQAYMPPLGWTTFAPTDVAGLRMWLRADSFGPSVADGEGIWIWPDASGSGNHAVQLSLVNRPSMIRNVSGLNSRPALRFDRSVATQEDWFDLGEMLDFSSATFVWVGRTNPSGTQWVFGDTGSSTNNVFRISTDGGNYTVRFRGSSGGPIDLASAGSEAASYHIATITLDSTGTDPTASLFVNGTLVSTLASGGYQPGNWMATPGPNYQTRLGKHPDSTNGEFLDGEIAEVLLFARAISEPERARLECYLRMTYGISGPVCP